ncbi:hypothetical protein [Micromonospora parathelypteridis]|uniref:Uncharacterized protein n=1 Tax=Micromonospora parathelypteridis TaxID=1839617 RepID=A0A840WCA8_9ACTN|nr:hypothetical protein [Micromonospora parathelypteridis]MBB5480631.1 hypothetical protein [Micromonospora parathelypteridis]
MRPEWEERPQSLVRLSIEDGAQIAQLILSAPASLVRCADGLPAVAPAGHVGERSRLRIRRGSRAYFREIDREREWTPEPIEAWLTAANLKDPPIAGRPREPTERDFRRLLPYSWVPG